MIGVRKQHHRHSQKITRTKRWKVLRMAILERDGLLIEGTAVSQWDRLVNNIPAGNIAMTTNGLAAPAGDPLAVSALLTTAAGGVAPVFVGAWGAVDVIRDPFTDAQSGGLRITALATMDLTVARPSQLEVLTGLELAGA